MASRYLHSLHTIPATLPSPYVHWEVKTAVTNGAAYCATYGYHLLVINSAAEDDWSNDTADTYSTSKFWIGYNDRTTEGSFEWVDGSTAVYTNWHSGEPNDAIGNEVAFDFNEQVSVQARTMRTANTERMLKSCSGGSS